MDNKIMDIQFKQGETDLMELQEMFNSIGNQALLMSHYELAERSGHSPIQWKTFLLDPRVAAVIAEELDMLKRSKVAIMLSSVDTNKNPRNFGWLSSQGSSLKQQSDDLKPMSQPIEPSGTRPTSLR